MKRIGIILLVVIGVVLLGVAGFAVVVYTSSEGILTDTYDVTVANVEIPSDSASIALGKHIAVTRGCVDCHGADYGGGLQDLGPLGHYEGSNLTKGNGGVGGSYTNRDWVRAIRHGVDPDGNGLKLMPSAEYYYLSDRDLGALIGYLKSLPPVDRTPAESTVGPIGRLLLYNGSLPVVSAHVIPHDAPRPPEPEMAVTEEFGEYVSKTCIGCHGHNLTGGINLKPGVPPSTNLTPTGLGDYSHSDFVRAVKTGKRPDGTMIDAFMPYKQFSYFKDTEVDALWMYLQSLPPRETGS